MIINLVADEDKIRLDKYLAEELEFSRSEIAKAIRDEKILLNKRPVKPSYLIQVGDLIDGIIDGKTIDLSPVSMDLDIIYEDDDLIAVNKPYDLVVHPSLSTSEPTLVNGLLAYTDKLSNLYGEDRPGIVHRLDRDTTGIILVAKTNACHEGLGALFKERQIRKEYVAIVNGKVSEEGIINKAIGRDKISRVKMAIDEVDGKEAISEYYPISYNDDYSLLRVNLITGRTHQIRVHMQYINRPILGDELYGLRKEKIKVYHQMLHAYSLTFTHPISGIEMSLKSEPNKHFKETLNKIGLDLNL